MTVIRWSINNRYSLEHPPIFVDRFSIFNWRVQTTLNNNRNWLVPATEDIQRLINQEIISGPRLLLLFTALVQQSPHFFRCDDRTLFNRQILFSIMLAVYQIYVRRYKAGVLTNFILKITTFPSCMSENLRDFAALNFGIKKTLKTLKFCVIV